MKSCDTNILVYYLDSSCKEHANAKTYLESIWADKKFVICDLVLIELYTLIRNPKVFARPFSAEEAKKCILGFRSNTNWRILEYASGTMDKVWETSSKILTRPMMIYDLRLGFCLLNSGVEEFATRKQQWTMPSYKVSRGTLFRYIKDVSSASLGCVTDE